MNIIIVGCGKVGRKLAQQLISEHEHNITVVDIKRDVLNDTVDKLDIIGFTGSGTSIKTLKEAGVENTDILIAVTGSDEINLLSCFIAKKISNCKTIARVREPDYKTAINLIKEDLGLAMTINPEKMAADQIARIMRFPSAIQIDTFAKGRVEIFKMHVPENSVLDNLKISDIDSKLNTNILVCGVERGDQAFIPDGSFVIQKDDYISIVASIEERNNFFKKTGIKTNPIKNTMIVGGGTTAYYLAERLIQSGVNVKIVEKNSKWCEELCVLLPKAVIINADGTNVNLLLEEGIENIDSFVSLTNIDEENVVLSLYAKTKTNGKIITKINRIEYDNVLENLDIGTTVYPKEITAETIVKFVRAACNTIGSEVETMHMILDGKAEALEFRIAKDSKIINIPLYKLNLKQNVLVACINRNGNIIIPKGSDSIFAGDTVIIVTKHEGFKDINDILA
ncbi:MAG: Trk system potassium transporter TrkA [Clostridia bacterium]|nr:Trk system potassium transporter TrkA [Clostridia bacterium]